jgi:hypothetical protein
LKNERFLGLGPLARQRRKAIEVFLVNHTGTGC